MTLNQGQEAAAERKQNHLHNTANRIGTVRGSRQEKHEKLTGVLPGEPSPKCQKVEMPQERSQAPDEKLRRHGWPTTHTSSWPVSKPEDPATGRIRGCPST